MAKHFFREYHFCVDGKGKIPLFYLRRTTFSILPNEFLKNCDGKVTEFFYRRIGTIIYHNVPNIIFDSDVF